MKNKYKLILLSLVCIMLESCQDEYIKKYNAVLKDSVNNLRVKVFDYNLPEIYNYEGCEYIVIGNGNCQMMSHKGNCKNKIHYK